MKKIIIILTILILINCVFVRIGLCWKPDTTHQHFSIYAADESVLGKAHYLKNLGFEEELLEEFTLDGKTRTVEDWLARGGEKEDSATLWDQCCGQARYENHFHNPLKPWPDAGLNDIATGWSSILWAQDRTEQASYPTEGDWSWQKVREVYYWALISTTETLRQVNFAQTFKGLGHQIHLVQDAAQPEHARNDTHVGDRNKMGHLTLEAWASGTIENLSDLKNKIPSQTLIFPSLPDPSTLTLDPEYASRNLAPSALFIDTDQYKASTPDQFFSSGLATSVSIGLAEYANANFASPDTIFTEDRSPTDNHYFPYPNKASTNLQDLINRNILPETVITEDGVSEPSLYIKKERDGEIIDHFLKLTYTATSRWSLVGGGQIYELDFYHDEECHKEYASNLISRAVGYSAGLLNYFFRGTLEITPPQQVAYAVTDGSITPYVDANGNYHQQFRSIKTGIRNSTPDTMPGEEIQAGILLAVVKYKIIPNYMYDLSNYPPDGNVMKDVEYSYSVSLPVTITSLSSSDPIEFTFDFSNSPIPAGITDLYLQVIYKGTLGNEQDIAVAVGMKDLMEPTHQVFWNATDMFQLDAHLYTSDEIKNTPALAARVDHDGDGVFNEEGEPYIDPHPLTFGIGYLSQPPGDVNPFTYSAITIVQPGEHIRAITLFDKPLDNYTVLEINDNIETEPQYFFFSSAGVLNQDENGVWQTPTPINTFRYGLDTDGVTQIPIRQHFRTAYFRCYPVDGTDPNGNPACYYSESEAIPGELLPSQIDMIYFP